MKKTILLLLLFCAMIMPADISAQLYVTDDCFSDSVSVYNIATAKDGSEMTGTVAFKLPVGVTVKAERLLTNNKADCQVTIDGKKYAMFCNSLILSNENPEGTESLFGEDTYAGHTPMGRFFATMTPYWIILILFAAAFLLTELGFRKWKFTKSAIVIVPILMMAAAILEALAYWTWGNNVFFWCDQDTYGFWGSIFRALPFIFFACFQVFSIIYYKILIRDVRPGAKLKIKPIVIGIAGCIPVAIVAAIVLSFVGIRGAKADMICSIIFLATLIGGVTVCAMRNIRELGLFAGLAFTVFATIYALGTVIAVWGVLVLLFKMILQVIILCLVSSYLCAILSGEKVDFKEESNGNKERIKTYSGLDIMMGVDVRDREREEEQRVGIAEAHRRRMMRNGKL